MIKHQKSRKGDKMIMRLAILNETPKKKAMYSVWKFSRKNIEQHEKSFELSMQDEENCELGKIRAMREG